MANTKSAKKATRVSARRETINKNRTSRVRSTVRKVEEAISTGNKEAAVTAMKAAASALYYLVPTFDPFAGRTLVLRRSMRVSIVDWRYLGITFSYALLSLSFGYVATIAVLRRRPMI